MRRERMLKAICGYGYESCEPTVAEAIHAGPYRTHPDDLFAILGNPAASEPDQRLLLAAACGLVTRHIWTITNWLEAGIFAPFDRGEYVLATTASLFSLALHEVRRDVWLRRLVVELPDASSDLYQGLLRVGHVIGWGSSRHALRHLQTQDIASTILTHVLYWGMHIQGSQEEFCAIARHPFYASNKGWAYQREAVLRLTRSLLVNDGFMLTYEPAGGLNWHRALEQLRTIMDDSR